MADSKVTQLTAVTMPPVATDLLYLVQNVATTPTSQKLTFIQSTYRPYTKKTSANSPYTVLSGDWAIYYDASGGNSIVNLPAAASNNNRILLVKRLNASNRVTVKANGAELIDGSNTYILNSQYASVMLHCDGTQWWVI